MKRQFTIKYTSNMKEQDVNVEATLWKGQRWYMNFLGGTLALDALTGEPVNTRNQINNPRLITAVQRELGF